MSRFVSSKQQWQLYLKSIIPLSTFVHQQLGQCEKDIIFTKW